MKNILLTGAGPRSFIGRNLKEQLAKQYTVFAPPHAQLELLNYDALQAYIAQYHIDAIVHAAVHVPMFNGAEKEYYNDMLMFLNIEKAAALVDKVVYFGSGAEYDKRFDITMAQEKDIGRHIPQTEYGLAKYTMNALTRRSENIYNLRLFGVFGRYELQNIKFISSLCCKALAGLPLTVRRECNFDFLYIDDVAPAVCWLLESTPPRHDYNLCHGTPYRLSKLAQMVKEISGASMDIEVLQEGRDLDYTGDNTMLLRDFTGFVVTPMRRAIEQLYLYYEHNQEMINKDVLKESR